MNGTQRFTLTLAVVLDLLCGCAPSPAADTPATPALTAEQAAQANTAAHLLERYQTVTYAQLNYANGDTTHKFFYTDDDGTLCATGDSSGYTDYQTDFLDFYHPEPGQSVYTLSAAEGTYVSAYLFVVSGSAFTAQTTDANGNWVCVAESDIDQAYADELSDFGTITTQDKMVTTTVFAPDDFRVLTIDFSIRRPDGTEIQIASGALFYDQEVRHTDAVQHYLDAPKVTVSVQMPDGSTRTAKLPQGASFEWVCDEGDALYLDPVGTRPVPETSQPVQADLTLYCLAKQGSSGEQST